MLRVESENVAASEIETMIMQIDPVTGCTVIREVIIRDYMPRSTLDKISKVDLRGQPPAIKT